MQTGFPFQPSQAGANCSVEAAVTTTATALTVPIVSATSATSNDAIRIAVTGNQSVYWAYGNVSATMTATGGVKMLAGSVEVFGLPLGITQITHNAVAAGSNISVSLGRGS